MTAIGVQLRWALRGKKEGQKDEYKVLAADCEGCDKIALLATINRLIPGTTAEAATGERNSLPWVIIGTGGTTERLRLGLAIVEWPDPPIVDYWRRPATLTRYFELDLHGATAHEIGYLNFYEAAGRIRLPTDQSSITPRSPDLQDYVTEIDTLGFPWIATVAALLLESRVIITGGPTDPTARVRAIEAITLLLPSGFRQDLVVSTWVPNDSDHIVRLGFGERARPDSRTVTWGVIPERERLSPLGAVYLDRVTRLRAHWGLLRLVDALWSDAGLYRFDTPAAAIDALDRLDKPYAVAEGVRSGKRAIADVRDVVSRHALNMADPETSETILFALVERGTVDDLDLLPGYWSDRVRKLVAERSVEEADMPSYGQRATLIAGRAGDADAFLCDAAEYARRTGQRSSLAKFVATLPEPAPNQWQSFRELVLADDSIGPLVLGAASAEVVRGWLTWLGQRRGGQPSWVRAFATAVFHENNDRRALGDCHGSIARAVLETANSHNQVPKVLPSLWFNLVNDAASGPLAESQKTATLLASLRDMPPEVQAGADLFLVLYGYPLARSPLHLPHVELTSYLQGVAYYLGELHRNDSKRALCALTASLLTWSPETPEWAVNIVERIAGVAERFRLRDVVLTTLAEAAANDPRVLGAVPSRLREQLVPLSDTLRRHQELADLEAAARNDDRLEELAPLWARIVLSPRPAREGLQALHKWPWAQDPERLYDLLNQLLHQLLSYPAASKGAWLAYTDATKGILEGDLGAEVAAKYYDLLEAVLKLEHAREHWLAPLLGVDAGARRRSRRFKKGK